MFRFGSSSGSSLSLSTCPSVCPPHTNPVKTSLSSLSHCCCCCCCCVSIIISTSPWLWFQSSIESHSSLMAMISSFPRLTCPSFSTNPRNQIFLLSNGGTSSIMIRDLNKRKICKLVYASAQKSENEVIVESKVETLLDSVKWDDKGLAVAIAQNVDTGDVLMQGFTNREALATTISSRKATFYSRSRSSLWTKGETSMNFIHIHDIYFDCDRDSIIYSGKPDGPTCHTGSETCYYLSVNDSLKHPEVESSSLARTTLYSLEHTISQRKTETEATNDGKLSWTKKLLLDKKLLCSKIREEADELCRTLEENEDKSRTASEMADVLYHSMVLLAVKDVKVEEVLEVLRQRFTKSGIEEKKSRKKIDKPE